MNNEIEHEEVEQLLSDQATIETYERKLQKLRERLGEYEKIRAAVTKYERLIALLRNDVPARGGQNASRSALYLILQANPGGITGRELCEQANIRHHSLAYHINTMRERGEVRVEGVGIGTRYFPGQGQMDDAGQGGQGEYREAEEEPFTGPAHSGGDSLFKYNDLLRVLGRRRMTQPQIAKAIAEETHGDVKTITRRVYPMVNYLVSKRQIVRKVMDGRIYIEAKK